MGLWDQLGGFFDNVGDVAAKVSDLGDQVQGAIATFAGLKSGSAAATPPLLPGSLPPGYGPLYPSPNGNAVNTSSMGAAAIQERINKRRRERELAALAVVGVGLLLLTRSG